MIELSHKGANHGWSVMEGSHPFLPGRKRGPTPIVPPVVEHHHSDCRSITGGYVYQGDKFKELRGLLPLWRLSVRQSVGTSLRLRRQKSDVAQSACDRVR